MKKGLKVLWSLVGGVEDELQIDVDVLFLLKELFVEGDVFARIYREVGEEMDVIDLRDGQSVKGGENGDEGR